MHISWISWRLLPAIALSLIHIWKLVVDLSKYNSTDKKYDVDYNAGSDLTAAQAVQKAIDIATEKIAAAAKETTDAAKISGYMNAYTEFKAAMDKIKTIADEEFESGRCV